MQNGYCEFKLTYTLNYEFWARLNHVSNSSIVIISEIHPVRVLEFWIQRRESIWANRHWNSSLYYNTRRK